MRIMELFMSENGKSLCKIIATCKWVYWLDKTKPLTLSETEPQYQVCVVVEGERCFDYVVGRNGEPWFWDENRCEAMNRERGYSPSHAIELVASVFRNIEANRHENS